MGTRDQEERSRMRRIQRQEAAIKRNRQIKSTTAQILDRDPDTGQWNWRPNDGSTALQGIKIFNKATVPGDTVYPTQRSDGAWILDGPKAPPLSDSTDNPCGGYLNGQVFNCPVDEKDPIGRVQVLFSVTETSGDINIYVGGHIKIPVVVYTIPAVEAADVTNITGTITNLGGTQYIIGLSIDTLASTGRNVRITNTTTSTREYDYTTLTNNNFLSIGGGFFIGFSGGQPQFVTVSDTGTVVTQQARYAQTGGTSAPNGASVSGTRTITYTGPGGGIIGYSTSYTSIYQSGYWIGGTVEWQGANTISYTESLVTPDPSFSFSTTTNNSFIQPLTPTYNIAYSYASTDNGTELTSATGIQGIDASDLLVSGDLQSAIYFATRYLSPTETLSEVHFVQGTVDTIVDSGAITPDWYLAPFFASSTLVDGVHYRTLSFIGPTTSSVIIQGSDYNTQSRIADFTERLYPLNKDSYDIIYRSYHP